jgi:chorismate mutase/prephenate dehydratase
MSIDSHLARSQADSAKESAMDELESLRQEINDLDSRDLEVSSTSALRAASGNRPLQAHHRHARVFAPEREEQVIGPGMPGQSRTASRQSDLRRIYSEIISACREMQNPLKVAFLGPDYTFSHQAALSRFGGEERSWPDRPPLPTCLLRCSAASARSAWCRWKIPVRAGVGATMDCLLASDLKVCGEVFAPVSHALMSRRERSWKPSPGSTPTPRALASAAAGWPAMCPRRCSIETESTAAAARPLGGRSRDLPRQEARKWPPATTGWICSGRGHTGRVSQPHPLSGAGAARSCPPTGDDKTSMVFPGQPSALAPCTAHSSHFASSVA